MTIQDIKARFGIIGFSSVLDHALNTARQVAPTDLTVLITGESGSEKRFSHKSYISLVPENTAHTLR